MVEIKTKPIHDSTLNDTYFMEIHKAKLLFSIIKNTMHTLDNLGINPQMKNSIKTDLNKVLQMLSLTNLKVIKQGGK